MEVTDVCEDVLGQEADFDQTIALIELSTQEMDRLPYRQKFLNDRNSKICYHSLKDHPKVSKIAKFRCVML